MRNLIFVIAFFMQCCVYAQLNITNLNQPQTIDFESTIDGINNSNFTAGGFSNTPAEGQLNSNGLIVTGLSDGDMDFGGEYTSGDYGRSQSTGGVNTGGIYSFEIEPDNLALGIQPTSSDMAPGSIILNVFNNTGISITDFTISYDICIYNNADRSGSCSFEYSSDNSSYISYIEGYQETPQTSDIEPSWTKESKTVSISTSVANNESAYLKWIFEDLGGSGSRDEIALDNITITAFDNSGTNTDVSIQNLLKLKIYPNPFHDIISIEAEADIVSIDILNNQGQLVKKENSLEGLLQTVSTEDLTPGIYFIKITDINNNETCNKIIKQ